MGKITFIGHVPVPHEELMEHVRLSRERGYPYVREVEKHGRPLAVVGGGPSISDHLEEIRTYADVWAINGACGFLREHGIDSTLISLDPSRLLADRVKGAKKALLASRCHPEVFDALDGCEITLFDVVQDCVPGGYGVWASVSTASVVFQLATDLGFRKTVFYGCEGSYAEKTHAYMDEKDLQDYRFIVECGGREYMTSPDLYQQTLAILPLMRMYRLHFEERGGGLLRAMIENDEHDITKVTQALKDGLTPLHDKCYPTGWHELYDVRVGEREAA